MSVPDRGAEVRLLSDLAGGLIARHIGEEGVQAYGVFASRRGSCRLRRSLPNVLVRRLISSGSIEEEGDCLVLTEAGRAALARMKAGRDGHLAQHRGHDRSAEERGCSDGFVNVLESPLGRLRARRTRDGKPYLADWQVQAGLRLLADFRLGGLQPRLGASLDSAGSPARRRSGGRHPTSPSDAALDARERFNRAIRVVGDDFGWILTEVCCFETGLSDVESRKGWPRRSAKLVLRFALNALARHYGLTSVK